MPFIPRIYFMLVFAAISCLLPAQNLLITYSKCDALYVCGTDTLGVTIQNNLNTTVSGATLNLALPMGISYVAGSVAGASEQDITNLSAPVFGLADLSPGQALTLNLLLGADCLAADLLDAGQLFILDLSVNSVQGNAQVSTSSIPVETGALVIESVDELLNGERFDTLLRTICIRNTRLGRIGRIHLEDDHLAGIDISIPNASGQTATSTLFSADFEGSLFQNIGNGDEWLDLDESLCLTEKIVITSCGVPAFTLPSLIRVGWSCGNTVCRYDSSMAFIEIQPYDKAPNLVFEPIWAPPTDYCAKIPAVMGYTIRNIGTARANNITTKLTLTKGLLEAGILDQSFRIVRASGTFPLSANLSVPYDLVCDSSALSEAFLTLPLLEAQDSMRLLFDVITCTEPEFCSQIRPEFKLDFLYQKDCPENGFVSGNVFIKADSSYAVLAKFESLIGQCLQDGLSYNFEYIVQTKYMLEDGFLRFTIQLPHGITLDPSCAFLLAGIPPVLHEVNNLPNFIQEIQLAWSTPLPDDSLSMNLCLVYDCDSVIHCEAVPADSHGPIFYTEDCCLLKMDNTTSWSPQLYTSPECRISFCDGRLLSGKYCTSSGGGGTPPPGVGTPYIYPHLTDWWDVYRLNPGWQDGNDDRHADLPVSPANGPIRRDRFLPGDTLRLAYGAALDSTGRIDTIGRTIWHEVVASDMNSNGVDEFPASLASDDFLDSTKFRFLANTIRVKYADGTTATCNWEAPHEFSDKNYIRFLVPNTFPYILIDEVSTENAFFLFVLSDMFAAGCLPKPYIEFGDSIFILSDYKLDVNFTPGSSNLPEPPLVGFRTATDAAGNIYAWNERPYKKLQYSGWQKRLKPNTNTIRPCDNSETVQKFEYSLHIARENMFPFEVRPLGWISGYQSTVPLGLNLQSATLELMGLQENVPYLSGLNLPFSQSPGFLNLDYSPAFVELPDEGYQLNTYLSFDPNCQVKVPDSSQQIVETSFFDCVNGMQKGHPDTLRSMIGFYSKLPRMQLQTGDTILYTQQTNFEINFDLKNIPNWSAPATWLAIVNPSGQISGLELFEMPQNQAISGFSGMYPLGPQPGNSKTVYRIRGLNNSCETDSLLLIYGWDCAPISSLSESACKRDTVLIELHMEEPELELDILEEPASLTLCDSSDWYLFELFNANYGFAYQVETTLKLPPGLNLLNGSCEISYPKGSPWAAIPDPQLLPGNLYHWNLNDILPLLTASGLPGIAQMPGNALQIRFKTITACGFVANTPVYYGTGGIRPCGQPANLLNKPGNPLKILGIDPAYGVQIALQPVGNQLNTCGTEQEFSIQLNLLGTPSAGDSVYLLLPQGVSYVSGSYVPGQNAPVQGPVGTIGGFELPLPILTGGGNLQFNFKVRFDATAGCDDKVMIAQTRVRTEAFCQSIGAACAVYVSTGEASWNLEIEHPVLTLGEPVIAVQNGELGTQINVTNAGNTPVNGATVQVWQDQDGNGMPDVLIQTLQTDALIAPGSSISLSGLLAGIDSSHLCGLMFVLPAAENCACTEQVVLPMVWDLSHTPQLYCSLQADSLGVSPQAGYHYQWIITPGNLSCDTCSITLFTPDAGTQPNMPLHLTLIESSGGCSVTHHFEVSYAEVAQLLVDKASICAGSTVVLSASPANAEYLWSGAGIQDPHAQIQTLQPASSGTYTVTITFVNGCSSILQTDIEVFKPDTTQLPALSTCAGVPVEVLGTLRDTAGIYHQNRFNQFGCDSVIYQQLNVLPGTLVESEAFFCAGDSIWILDSLFKKSGELNLTLPGFNGCDSMLHVVVKEIQPPFLSPVDTIFGNFGQIITLSGPDGFVTYVWEPAPLPPCPNCPEVSYPADSTGYREYLLTVARQDGCPSDLLYRVFIFPPCSAERVQIPNAFTPNGDGFNDVFRVVPQEGSEQVSSLEIYDRWGEKVYENNGDAYWDGTINGKPAPSDVYVYIVKVSCGELVGKRVGDVSLLR